LQKWPRVKASKGEGGKLNNELNFVATDTVITCYKVKTIPTDNMFWGKTRRVPKGVSNPAPVTKSPKTKRESGGCEPSVNAPGQADKGKDHFRQPIVRQNAVSARTERSNIVTPCPTKRERFQEGGKNTRSVVAEISRKGKEKNSDRQTKGPKSMGTKKKKPGVTRKKGNKFSQ